jgi:hypothetical protein
MKMFVGVWLQDYLKGRIYSQSMFFSISASCPMFVYSVCPSVCLFVLFFWLHFLSVSIEIMERSVESKTFNTLPSLQIYMIDLMILFISSVSIAVALTLFIYMIYTYGRVIVFFNPHICC